MQPVPIDQTFQMLLREARKQEILRTKGKPKLPKFPAPSWRFPVLLERRYTNYLVNLFKGLAKVGKAFHKDYPALLTKYQGKTDAWGYHADETSFDLTLQLRQDLEAEQEQMDLGPGGAVEAAVYTAADDVATWNAKRWAIERQISLGMVYDPAEPWMQEALSEWTDTNTRLVKSLSGEYLTRMETLAIEALQTGKRPEALLVDILKLNQNLTVSRARLIAQDQLAKLVSTIQEKRSVAMGMDTYTWATAADERVRGNPRGRYPNAVPSHYLANGKVGVYGKPDIWLVNGREVGRGMSEPSGPGGMAIRCRCVNLARWEDLLKPIDQSLLSDEHVQAEMKAMGY
jgi:uncharacterized protein with gpF-like domain